MTLFSGSILSAASIHSNVSILATIAIVNPTTQTSYVDIDEKLGNEKKPIKSLKLFAIGSLTRCSSATASGEDCNIKNSLIPIPAITAINAPGINLIFFKKSILLNAIKIASETKHIKNDPGCE